MVRRGHNPITVRLTDDVMGRVRERANATERGRSGGGTEYVRRLIYSDLGLGDPPPYAPKEVGEVIPRTKARAERTRVEASLPCQATHVFSCRRFQVLQWVIQCGYTVHTVDSPRMEVTAWCSSG
jgi:hypothetical protein